jgi:3-deoxy-manno-octulosonate cytidylyltransferase (CMP-KDO synthetase)
MPRPHPDNTLIVIPARLGSTRLPGKALAEIGGEAMTVQVWRRARESGAGKVLVAAA